ncbi:MAG: S8 family serine peptidase [Ilumatobacteraceae bacterium]
MYFTGRHGEQLDLTLVTEERVPPDIGLDTVALGVGDDVAAIGPLAAAARSHFEATAPRRARSPLPQLPLMRDSDSGRLRTVYKEIVIRFTAASTDAQRRKLLKAHRLTIQRPNPFIADQVVVKGASVGLDLLDPANALAAADEVVFAVPNFVTQYRRVAPVRIATAQWQLDNRATLQGQLAGEDVNARDAWKLTRGRPSVLVAVIDDGVDIDHPNLKARIWRNPDRNDPDRHGRDFFIPDDNPDHFDPRPKRFQFPFDETAVNDIHGTPCAGVVAAAGRAAWGIAPRCRILPVKVFHADEMAADERVADSIRYAASRAAVLSCSWTGARTPDLATAIEDAGVLGRRGLGSPVLFATGNEASTVGYPASDPNAIGVGASTDQAKLASYSNRGPEVSVVAPSGGGIADIYTTDVSIPGRGYNPAPMPDGAHTDTFSGTSSATPLAAGVAALVISANPALTRDEVRDVLQNTATRIGRGYDGAGHSDRFGHGRVDAMAAVTEARRRRRSR